MRTANLFLKRLIDLVGSICGVIFLSPLLLLTAVLIKCTSQGTVFFRQTRLGKGGKPFSILKFRTMVMGAEGLGAGIKVSDASDSRITQMGKILRKTSIDELPQLFNVIKGEMSLVGPRPPVTYHPYEGYEGYPPEAKKRFQMRPGMTGLAQVKVRNATGWEERIRYDIEYVKRFNICLDFVILAKTVFVVLRTDNVYAGK